MENDTRALLKTDKGDIVLRLFGDMPVTAGNFSELVSEGFYDGTVFHRIIPGFMVQGGDPDGNGCGGPGYNIPDEFVAGHSNQRGSVAMANTGRPDSGGSQFFINMADNSYLDWDDARYPHIRHPVFAEVLEGMEAVDAIAAVPTGPQDRPSEEVRILKALLL